MKEIITPNIKILKMWGKQTVDSMKKYRLLKFVLSTECDEGLLLQNCITGEMLLLSNTEKESLAKLPNEYDSNMDLLVKKHFLVPVDSDDKKVVNQLRTAFKIMYPQKDVLTYTILPTTACNARCFYCYESGMPCLSMDEETASQVVRFIKTNSHGKEVHIQWFGGEPLVAKPIIDQICRELKENSVDFYSSMVSNGYLFTEALVNHSKENWKVKKVQITLDGTEEIYNKSKAYVNVTGSPYKRVMENVSLLLKADIAIELRMNLSKHNFDDLKALIDELKLRFGNEEKLTPYVSLLLSGVGFNPIHCADDETDRLEQRKVELEEYIVESGFVSSKKHFPYLQNISCMANNDAAVIINPQGSIGKCEHHIFDELIGDIYNDKKNDSVISSWKQTAEWEHCEGCPIYPSCIVLKKCPSADKCSKIIKKRKIDVYKRNMLDTYNYWKSKILTEG